MYINRQANNFFSIQKLRDNILNCSALFPDTNSLDRKR
jgi:hypothetical protein